MNRIAKLLRVRGKVQGVMFRESMRKEAERLNVKGWVRNRHDSSVEAFVQGSPENVLALMEWARRGPPQAMVNGLTAEDAQPDPQLKSFERKETI